MVNEWFATAYATMWLCYFTGILTAYAMYHVHGAWKEKKKRKLEAMRRLLLSENYDGELVCECNCQECLEVRAQIRADYHLIDDESCPGEWGSDQRNAFEEGWFNDISDEGELVDDCARTETQRRNTW